MCGRYALQLNLNQLAALFDLPDVLDMPEGLLARYNIAPTQHVAVVRVAGTTGQPARELAALRWGLVPSWAKQRLGSEGPLINARAETVADKPTFRDPFQRRRCVIPATGFYEWKPVPGRSKKQPYFIRLRDADGFGMAGIWDRWEDPKTGEVIESCAIITTTANELIRPMHERMPVILSQEHYHAWLDPRVCDTARLTPLLTVMPAARMEAYAVGWRVNNVQNDDAGLIAPLPADEKTQLVPSSKRKGQQGQRQRELF